LPAENSRGANTLVADCLAATGNSLNSGTNGRGLYLRYEIKLYAEYIILLKGMSNWVSKEALDFIRTKKVFMMVPCLEIIL
jgi:hypothetical protein